MALLQLERISAQYPGAAEPVLADISLSLDFGQRYAAGESARSIKSDPRFIETLSLIHI